MSSFISILLILFAHVFQNKFLCYISLHFYRFRTFLEYNIEFDYTGMAVVKTC